jgi:hypothetical protein
VPIRLFFFAVSTGLVFVLFAHRSSRAAVAYSTAGSTYSQNFNNLSSSGTDIAWSNDSTLPGWSLFRITSNTNATPVAIQAYDSSDGSATTGRFYSFGTNSDRALGGVGNGTFGTASSQVTGVGFNKPVGWIAASFSNNTGSALNRFTVSYDGEQWRDAGDNGPPYAQTMNFEYGFGTDFSSVATWTAPGSSFNFTSPVYTTNARAIDGNSAGLAANLGGTVSSLAWQSGSTLWVRWIEQNDLGGDAGLGFDNFSFSATVTAVPEASALELVTLLCATVGGVAFAKTLIRGRRTSSGC